MKRLFFICLTLVLTLALGMGQAEAARLGGSKSFGMQRQSVAPKPATPPSSQATPAPAPSPASPAPAATPKRNWLGPLAGLAAGLGIAALLSHFGLGEGMANILMIALLVMAAVFIFKFLFRRKSGETPFSGQPVEPMQYANAGSSPHMAPPAVSLPGQVATATTDSTGRVPAGFDTESFLRVAKLNFIRLQAANDAKNLDDIREFVSPEMFAEIKMQMDERGTAPQQTDVVSLNAELLEVSTESTRHIASVHFSGLISEVAGAAAVPFNEVWNLCKSTEGNKGWVVAGIQQVS